MNLAWDIHVLARTLYGEARGEPPEGQAAVGSVIINRLHDKRFPKTVAGVCLQAKQFSAWNDDDPNRDKMAQVSDDDLAPFYLLATRLIDGIEPDNTNGSTHYFAGAETPAWAKGRAPVVTIGRHAFLNDVP